MCSVRAKLKERMANFCSGFSFPENQSGRRGHYEQSGPGRCEGANSKWGASSIGPPKPNTQWNSRQTSMSDSRGVQGEEGQTRIAIRDITPHQANTVRVLCLMQSTTPILPTVYNFTTNCLHYNHTPVYLTLY